MFESIFAAPTDPILGLAELFHADKRHNKINLGIGVYKDETGNTPILNSVKQAEQYLLENETTKNYLNIDGLSDFARFTQELLFGINSEIIHTNRACTAQTPGGTSALRIAADFIATNTNIKRIWISNPSWPNHKNIFSSAGLQVCYYNYYNSISHELDFCGMLTSLQKANACDAVLFHGCCHNPTGLDPTINQWKILATLSKKKGWLPLFDLAYQGFAYGLDEDTKGLRIFAASHDELIISNSYSKNFGLYNERVGGLTLIAANSDIAKTTFSQVKYNIRANYSNPPVHGAAIVVTILNDRLLRKIWEQELYYMRQRIQNMRYQFMQILSEKGKNFNFIINQKGMFSFIGLDQDQILRLREDFAIYAVNSSRINIAGITLENISRLCKAIIEVL
ncbi:amino acid aminotransferase [Pantoea sp. Aalb]|uniref:amino acid aminotransferase n=1 Tax=Pantoea sp. Aalb TaxID=2576762 RepID=UPI001320BF80|nr:amino acid aminotransferase [Pantoea sp. Aalb]MXP67487.1 aspartate/tyrosine/aromatic aminotransferase [Pantoea sp. Aalb]